MLKCPFYDSYSACSLHSDCLFLKEGGCSLVLSVTIGEENQKKLKSVETELNNLNYKVDSIMNTLNFLRG